MQLCALSHRNTKLTNSVWWRLTFSSGAEAPQAHATSLGLDVGINSINASVTFWGTAFLHIVDASISLILPDFMFQ